jgi:hypothetical protein
VLLISAYTCGLAVCDDRVSETYTVKLNAIPLRSDVAETKRELIVVVIRMRYAYEIKQER